MSQAQKRGFQVIDEQESSQQPAADPLTKASTAFLLLSLKALSQRAMTAVTNLMTITLVASSWFLWRSVLENPSVTQLIGVGMYALFVLLIDIVRRRS